MRFFIVLFLLFSLFSVRFFGFGESFAEGVDSSEYVLETKDEYKKSTRDIVEDVLKSTISIEAIKLEGMVDRKSSYYVLKKFGNIIETGAGFLISKDGYVITNNHVVKDADKIIITIDNKEYQADLVGDDEYLDIALLKIKNGGESFPFLELKPNIDMGVGDRVIIVGNPYNLGLSVSTGIISALNRNIRDTGYSDLIQTDANINKGNSGGPIFNENGDVIGVNSIVFSPEDGKNVGISFAIPIKNVVAIIDKLKKFGYIQRGWIGIRGKDSTEDIFKILNSKRESGVLVESVIDGSPAEKAGIRPADIIVSYNGRKIKNFNDLVVRIRNSGVNNTATILVLRNGKYIKYKVNVEELSSDKNYEFNSLIRSSSVKTMDMILTQIDKSLVNKYKLYSGYINNGMYVLKVDDGGIAEKNGIESGDIILSINQVQLKNKDVLNNVLNSLEINEQNEVIVVVKKYKSLENIILRMKLRND